LVLKKLDAINARHLHVEATTAYGPLADCCQGYFTSSAVSIGTVFLSFADMPPGYWRRHPHKFFAHVT
jgi:hypothetical protein